jgi:hypothetical protein
VARRDRRSGPGAAELDRGAPDMGFTRVRFCSIAQDNMRIMNENVMLIKEINDLRREMRVLKQKAGSGDAATGPGAKKGGKRVQSGGRPLPPSLDQAGREIEMQKAEIAKLQVRQRYRPSAVGLFGSSHPLGGEMAWL